jgi:hypothetical protein
MSNIAKLQEAMADLSLVNAAIERWGAIDRRALTEEITQYNVGRGLSPGRAETYAESDTLAVKKIVGALSNLHGWMATLDNNLTQEKIIS